MYTGYKQLAAQKVPDILTSSETKAAPKKIQRRGSLIGKEEMAKLKIQSFSSIDEKAVAAILGLNS